MSLLSAGTQAPVDVTVFSRVHILEILCVILFALFATREYLNFDPNMRVKGNEVEWLTGYGQVAYQGLRDTGTIPLWNPYYQQGEPLIDSAFSYLLNPFSSLPQLILGATNGTKISIVVQAMIVGFGGWFLGRVMGLSVVGRLTLALLLIGKGNMHTNFSAGFFQLASQQVYFPWVMAGVLGILRTQSRWAIILTGLSFSLMLFAGNLWHLLPMVVSVLVVIAVFVGLNKLNRMVIFRLVATGCVTVGLSAVTLLSIISNFGLLEAHHDEPRAGWELVYPNLSYLYPFVGDYDFVTKDRLITIPSRESRDADTVSLVTWTMVGHFYYSYVAPWWYVLLIVLPVPFMLHHREKLLDNRLLWLAGIPLFIGFTMWGMGGTPIFVWLYEHVPYLAQWRFVSRAMGMASFWVAVLVSLRADALVRLLWYHRQQSLRFIFGGLLIGFSIFTVTAWVDVTSRWRDAPLIETDKDFEVCLNWLHDAEPNEFHPLWVSGYETITSLIKNKIRMVNIEADYMLDTMPNTVGDPRLDFRGRLTGRRTLTYLDTILAFEELGYTPRLDSPYYIPDVHCIYENPAYDLPYAFVATVDDWSDIPFTAQFNFELTQMVLDMTDVRGVVDVVRTYDTIGVYVHGNTISSKQVLVIQELAYPGWEVWVDGIAHPIQIMGKLNALELPQDSVYHEIIFLYRPPLLKIGGMITIVTALLSIGFLLRLDKKIRRRL